MMKRLLTLSLILTMSVASFAQSIKGKVSDASGAGLPGVSVVLVGTSKGTTTDGEGNYSIRSGEGKFPLKASFIGYETQTIIVTVGVDGKTQNFTLKESASALNDVVIIGSRSTTGRTNTLTPVPVDIISTKELKGFSQVDVGQILNVVAPSFNSNRQTVTDGTDHVDPISLRGLGPDQVLVLVNGKRRHTSALININGSVGRGATGTDLNVIPVASIDHIEVLRDGAAAQYGSDAIAGVINIVLKKDYEGLSASLTTGQNMTTMNYQIPNISGGVYNKSQSITDGAVMQFDLSKGFRLGKEGYLTISGQINDHERTNRSAEDNAPTIYLGASGGFPSTPSGQDVTAFRKKLIADDATLVAQKGYNRQNMILGNSNARNYGVFINGGIPTNRNSEFYFTAGVTYRSGSGYGNNRIPVSRTQQPLKADGTLFYPDGFLPAISTIIQDQSLLAGYKTKLGSWNMDISNTYGHNSFRFDVNNSGNATLPAADNAQTSFYAGTLKFTQNTTDIDFSKRYEKVGSIVGLNLAFGAEYRMENFQIEAGEPNSYGQVASLVKVPAAPLTIGGAANGTAVAVPGAQVFPGYKDTDAINKSRNNLGIYVDTEGEIGKLLLGVAGRFENYSDFGSNFSGKVSARYRLTDAIALRGSASTGFRAPSLQQRYFQNTSTQFVNGLPSNTLTVNNDNPIARTVVGVDALKPETSVSYTLGATAKINNSFSLTVDAYQIEIKDRIVYSGSFSAAQLKLDPVAYNGINVVRFFANAVNTRTQGLDIVASERIAMGRNKLVLTAALNFNNNKVTAINSTPLINDPKNNDPATNPNSWFKNQLFDRQQVALIESYLPKNKLNLSATYSIGRFDISARTVRFGEVKILASSDPYAINPASTATDKRWNSQYLLDANGQAYIDQTFNAIWVTDLVLSYKINNGLNLSVGANNLFDVYPNQIFIDPRNAYGSVDYNSGRDASNRGRFLYPSNQGSYNGRFVFAKLSLKL